MKILNKEMQRFIDHDLQEALVDVKNELDAKQFDFEK